MMTVMFRFMWVDELGVKNYFINIASYLEDSSGRCRPVLAVAVRKRVKARIVQDHRTSSGTEFKSSDKTYSQNKILTIYYLKRTINQLHSCLLSLVFGLRRKQSSCT